MKRTVLFVLLFALALTFAAAGCDSGSGESLDGGSYAGSVLYKENVLYPERKVEFDGVKSNEAFLVSSPDGDTLQDAENFATAGGGELINCAVTSSPGVDFRTAKVNFFVGGVKDNDDIRVYQLENVQWVQLTVSEVRRDHVTVVMSRNGVLAFVRMFN